MYAFPVFSPCVLNKHRSSCHVFNCKNRKIGGWRLSRFRCLARWVVEFNYSTSVRLIQVGNNRNHQFKYFLGVRVRLIEVSA